MNLIISILSGYLIGSFNTAYICGRLHGFDIRERGSRNAGASNAKLCLGWGYFLLVAVIDILKSIIAFYLIKLIFGSQDNIELLAFVAALAAVFGHCFPFYLGFKGGKGFATYIGLCFLIDPLITLILLAVLLVLSYLVRYILVATFGLSIFMPIISYLNSHGILLEFIIVLLAALLVVYRHKTNIRKFMNDEELDINGNHIGISSINSFFG